MGKAFITIRIIIDASEIIVASDKVTRIDAINMYLHSIIGSKYIVTIIQFNNSTQLAYEAADIFLFYKRGKCTGIFLNQILGTGI